MSIVDDRDAAFVRELDSLLKRYGVRAVHAWITAGGKVQVHGPLHDKILCQRLLDIAKDEVEKYTPQVLVVTPEPAIICKTTGRQLNGVH